MATAPNSIDMLPIGFHVGNTISYLSQNYGDGFLAIQEGTQNAIDAHASNIFIDIDCPRKVIKIFDDGVGAGYDEIRRKFEQIGLSLKLDDPGALGEKGIGNLAAMSIARQWQLLTKDKNNPADVYRLYTFDREETKKGNNVHVSCEKSTQIKRITGALFNAQTMLRFLDVQEISLRQLGDHAVLSKKLTEAFGSKLKARKIDLTVSYRGFDEKTVKFVVKPPQFRGRPMDPEKYDTRYGYVEFAFFHSPKPLANPSVLVLHRGNYNIPLGNFFKLRYFNPEIEALFQRGYFEGEIRLGFCEQAPSHDRFIQNDEFVEFVKTVERFVNEILRPLVDQLDQEGREEKHRKIAESVLRSIKGYLKKHPNSLPPSFKEALYEKGEEGEEGGKGSGKDKKKIKSKKPGQPPRRKPLEPDAFKKQRQKSKDGEKKGTYVLKLHDGISLLMVYPGPEEGYAWHARSANGPIEINTANVDFLDTERRGASKLRDYMLQLAVKELAAASVPPGEAQIFNRIFEGPFMNFWRASLE